MASIGKARLVDNRIALFRVPLCSRILPGNRNRRCDGVKEHYSAAGQSGHLKVSKGFKSVTAHRISAILKVGQLWYSGEHSS
jgi:hypothetical protein